MGYIRNNIFQPKGRTALQGTLPDHELTPTRFGKMLPDLSVPFDVAPNFGRPEIRASRGHSEQVAIVPVPETAIHHDDGSEAGKD